MNELISARRFLSDHISEHSELLCAVSGGLDSMCLLDFAITWAKEHGAGVTAAHFNHGLRGSRADRDEAFVREYCASRGILLLAGRGDTRALAARDGLSIEEAARRLRYEFLESAAEQRGSTAILTAHHADDNAETMLLNLCRGTGSAGLGIPAVRGKILRPFLQISRAELAVYAALRAIPHVEDETNALDDAARNLLRHKVLPILKEINPRAVENMARASSILTDENETLDTMASTLLDGEKTGCGFARLSLKMLFEQPAALQGRMVLQRMEAACGHRRDLSAVHVKAVLELGKQQEISLPYGLQARNTGEELLFQLTSALPEPVQIFLDQTVQFGTWRVTLSTTAREDCEYNYRIRVPLPEPLQLTAWRSADRMNVAGSRGPRSLKRLWADAGVLPSRRDGMPVLRLGERPIAAPCLGVDSEFTPNGDTAYLRFYEIKGEQQ